MEALLGCINVVNSVTTLATTSTSASIRTVSFAVTVLLTALDAVSVSYGLKNDLAGQEPGTLLNISTITPVYNERCLRCFAGPRSLLFCRILSVVTCSITLSQNLRSVSGEVAVIVQSIVLIVAYAWMICQSILAIVRK